MRATVDCEEYFQFQHGDGRLKLIERLARRVQKLCHRRRDEVSAQQGRRIERV
jgi:hypothetical protein